MKRRSFLTLAFRAAATVACFGVARISIAEPHEATTPFLDWETGEIYMPRGEWTVSFFAKSDYTNGEWKEFEYRMYCNENGYHNPLLSFGRNAKIADLKVLYA